MIATNRNRPVSKVILAIMVMAMPLLLSCGSSSDETVASGGIGGTGATAGLVSDYGSIFVNGVEFDTSDADIVVEVEWVGYGDQAARTHLPIGQAVVVQGDLLNEITGSAIQVAPITASKDPSLKSKSSAATYANSLSSAKPSLSTRRPPYQVLQWGTLHRTWY